jgi:ribosome maturation factor RimP
MAILIEIQPIYENNYLDIWYTSNKILPLRLIREEGGSSPSFYFLDMIEKTIVKEIVDDFLKDSENYLIDVEVKSGNTIVVIIDNDRFVSIDDCIALNKFIESRLDREVEDYELEVGSAGIGQPFKVLRQYRKHIGKEVETLVKGTKYSGVLKEVNEEGIVLTVTKQIKPEGAKRKITTEEDLSFPFGDIKQTKYLISFK